MTPLFADAWSGLPPFERLEEAAFRTGFETEIAAYRARIRAIADAPDPPSFENTVAAMERARRPLGRLSRVFFALASAESTPELQAIEREVGPTLARLRSEVLTDPALFGRVDALVKAGAETGEEARVLALTHRDFRRAGAELPSDKKARLSEIMARLAELGTAFSQNVLDDEKGYALALTEEDLTGLPEFLVSAARSAAEARGLAGHAVTLSRSLIVPFLQFSDRRDLREAAFKAWVARGTGAGAGGAATSNTAIVAEILALRAERATLLGHPDFASFKLAPEMAETPEAVHAMLEAVWTPARAAAERDAEALVQRLRADGVNDSLQPWDWRYYATQRQADEHAIDEVALKSYFTLDSMIAAAFHCAERLFDLSFQPLEATLYHPDARAWSVARRGAPIGTLIIDPFARPNKRSGAWCGSFQSQSRLDGAVQPIPYIVCNFAKPDAGAPALLTYDDAETLFHEFGHALHNLLSDVTYETIAGTAVARDFVELPSQLFEHWLSTPEVLRRFARHAETGAPMPEDLIARLQAARGFDQGFKTVEYLASALVDLAFHTGAPPLDPMAAQAEVLAAHGMPPAITMRHATPHFLHVFAGDGYSAGYYSYMWSEMMDADAFAAFMETGDPFDRPTAERLCRHIYAAGGSADAKALYTAFRGRLPDVSALLAQRGFASAEA